MIARFRLRPAPTTLRSRVPNVLGSGTIGGPPSGFLPMPGRAARRLDQTPCRLDWAALRVPDPDTMPRWPEHRTITP